MVARSATTERRQYLITHHLTGERTLVNSVYRGWYHADGMKAAHCAGYRFLAECSVRLVPRGKEVPLPFDDLPLVITRAYEALEEAPAA